MTTACKIYSTNIFILSSSPYSSTSFAVKSMLYKRYRASCNHCKMSKTRISRNLGVKPLLHFLGLHGHNVYARVQVYDNFGYGMVASYYQLDFVANTNKLFFTSSRWPYSIEQPLVIDDMAAALSPLHATSTAIGWTCLIVAGLFTLASYVLRKQWAMWWGIIATVVAVVYFLRNYTAFALLFIGLLPIVFVIWRLLRTNKKL